MLARSVNRILRKSGVKRCFSVLSSPSFRGVHLDMMSKQSSSSSFLLTNIIAQSATEQLKRQVRILNKSGSRGFSSQGGGIGSAPWINGQNQGPGEALSQYSVDLTQMAKDGKLDPVIGRHEEIRRTLQILARRTKNNPVLIGEPGM